MQEENKQIDPGTMERLVQGNEQIGYYRSISNYEEALKISKEMLELVKELGLQESEAHGTTLLNAATAYRAAGMCEKAIAMYRAAEQIFKNLGIQDERLAGLYNNMSMAFQQKKTMGRQRAVFCRRLQLLETFRIIKWKRRQPMQIWRQSAMKRKNLHKGLNMCRGRLNDLRNVKKRCALLRCVGTSCTGAL